MSGVRRFMLSLKIRSSRPLLSLRKSIAALGLGNAESRPSLQVMPPSCDSRSDDVADRLGVVVAATAAIGDQILVIELHDGRLNVSLRRTDRAGLRPGLLDGIKPQEQRRAVGPDQLGIVAGLVIDRQQVIAVIEHDWPAADHVPLVEREDRGIGPRLGMVARDLELKPRRRPGVAVPDDIKQPDEAIGGFPDDAVADRTEGVVGDRLSACVQVLSPFLSREPKTAVSIAYSPPPP